MQEAPDGCLISETFLNLIASFINIQKMDLDRLKDPTYQLESNSINESMLDEEADRSYLGLGNIMNDLKA